MSSRRRDFLGTSTALAGTAMLAPGGLAIAQETPVLRIGATSVEGQAEAYYADEQGYFKKAGLAIEIVPMKGGAATVAAIVGGSLDIGCSNPVSIAQALQRGVPLVMLVPGSIWDTRFPTGYAVVAPDSPIKSPKELEGQVVAVTSLGGLSHLLMMAYIQQAGGQIATVKFIELSPSAMVDALLLGRIAASYIDDPEVTAFASRIRTLGPAPNAVAKLFAQTVWFSSPDWLARNKETARRFIEVVIAGGKWAMANQEAAAGVLEKRLGLKEARARVRFATTTDPALLQVVLDSAAKYKMLPPIRAADYLWNGK
jgi:NitT/TauT family transport system substrate-binding protein